MNFQKKGDKTGWQDRRLSAFSSTVSGLILCFVIPAKAGIHNYWRPGFRIKPALSAAERVRNDNLPNRTWQAANVWPKNRPLWYYRPVVHANIVKQARTAAPSSNPSDHLEERLANPDLTLLLALAYSAMRMSSNHNCTPVRSLCSATISKRSTAAQS